MEESTAALRQQISQQEFSAEDVERQAAERWRVKEAMLNARDAKTKARKVNLALITARCATGVVFSFPPPPLFSVYFSTFLAILFVNSLLIVAF